MYIPECTITYLHKNGRQYSGNLKSSGLKPQVHDRNGEISVTIFSKEPIRLVSFSMYFHWICETDERFFMNGFRSDSPCMETRRDNKLSYIPSYIRGHLHVSTAAKLFGAYDIHNGSPMGFSYCYFRTSRNNYRLIASLSERNGYTIFQYDGIDRIIYVSKDVEGVDVAPGEYKLMSIKIYDGTEDQVFTQWMDDLHMPKIDATPMGGFSTMGMAHNMDASGILDSIDSLSLFSSEAKWIMVTEGWNIAKGDWTPAPYKFPEGMIQIAERAHQRGLKAALWITPFSIDRRSQLARQHREWIRRDRTGKVVNSPMDVNVVALDTSRADVIDYIRRLIQTITEKWGFDMLIAGDLYMAGIVPQDGHSRAESMYRAMELLDELTGDIPVMGEDVPLMPAFGKIEYCHLSTGTPVTTRNAFRSVRALMDYFTPDRSLLGSLFRRQLSGRVWVNTPKEYSLITNGKRLLDKTKHRNAIVTGMLGSPQLVTDNPAQYSKDQAELVKQNMSGSGRRIRRVYEANKQLMVEYLEGDEIRTVTV